MRKRWSLLCISALAAGHAYAADDIGKTYLNLQYGYTWVDPARGVDNGEYWAVGFGKHLSRLWTLEINGLEAGFENSAGRKFDLEAFSLDALLVGYRSQSVSPYFTFGLGYLDTTVNKSDTRDGILGQVGVGLLMKVASNANKSFLLQLRPEIKLRYDWAGRDLHSNFHDSFISLGLMFNFGPPRQPDHPAVEPLPPPLPPPSQSPGPPPDEDGDGIVDAVDKCPGTPPGVAVDIVGCPRTGGVTLRGVEFEFNSAKLTAASHAELDKVAEDLRKHLRLKVELQGHTDSVGSDAYNLRLSQQRADSVREYLLSQGVFGSQLTAKGYGETQPIADNNTADGRAENRRVVMRVTDNPRDVTVKDEESKP